MIRVAPISDKLNIFGHKFKVTQLKQDEYILKIYLPILCYLRIIISKNRIKITSRTFIGIDFLTVEWNLIVYSIILSVLLAYRLIPTHSEIVILFAVFISYYLMCIIKLEALKVILLSWIDMEVQRQEVE
jgi:hypothetical protein